MLYRTINALFSTAVVKRLLSVPEVDDRREMGTFLNHDAARADAFLDDLGGLAAVAGKRVLDVGCGVGGKTVAVAAAAREVVALDSDLEKIHHAQRYANHKGATNIRFAVQDVTDLAIADQRFDLILMLDVIEHLNDPVRVLGICAGVLDDHGSVYIGFPPYRSPWGGHLFQHVAIPWAHLLFPDRKLLEVWRTKHVEATQRGKVYATGERMRCIMEAETTAELWGLNRLTIRGFIECIDDSPFAIQQLRLKAPAALGRVVSHIPGIRELLVTRVSAVLEKKC